jgi:hypothetical protein
MRKRFRGKTILLFVQAGRIEWTTGWRDLFAAPPTSHLFFFSSPMTNDNSATPKNKILTMTTITTTA